MKQPFLALILGDDRGVRLRERANIKRRLVGIWHPVPEANRRAR